MVEQDESPLAACRREVAEEIGLALEIGRLLCVDYRSPDASATEALYMAFWGGVLSEAQIASIVLPPQELEAHCFVPLSEGLKILAPRLARRIDASLRAHASGETLYLEDGEPALASRRDSAHGL
jgi:8-oxo-dGTP pyrophosphatase MutT (NUDIX family)